MESNIVKFEFQALAENQGFARTVASAYLAPLDPTVEEMTELKTAVSEAVSNAIIHGYEGTGQGTIEMMIKTVDNDKIWIDIRDFGKGIEDIEMARTPMFSSRQDDEMSGMGFTVMESFVDRVYVKSKVGEGTAVTLIKTLDIYSGR